MRNEKEAAGGPRQVQSAATRKAVLEAARVEFERVGFERANIRAIAARAKVTGGTVIHHFGQKKDLLHAALFDDLEDVLEHVIAHAPSRPIEAQLAALTQGVFRYYQRRPALSRTLLKESLFAEGAWALKFTEQVTQVHQAIARWVKSAIERGELAPEVEAPLVAVAYLSFFYFALIGWAQGAHPDPVTLVDHLVAQHLAGLRGVKAAPQRRGR